MRNSSKGPRTKRQVSESLISHVNTYALAAGAAGVSILALVQPAEAEIVVTHAHGTVGYNKTVSIDLNHDGVPDFRLTLPFSGYHLFKGTLLVHPRGAGGVIGTAGGFASRMVQGASIGSGQVFTEGKALPLVKSVVLASCGSYYRNLFGPWQDAQNCFLGVSFLIEGATHYGWIRLTVTTNTGSIAATVTGYAYETIAGQGIKAGQMVEEASAPAEPAPLAKASLGILALGSQGMELWRREESLLAAQ
jgi:hypothetical protein